MHVRANESADANGLGNDDMRIRSTGILGLYPNTASNELIPMDLLTELLYANSTVGNIVSHAQICSPTRHLRRFPRLLFTTSVWPSV